MNSTFEFTKLLNTSEIINTINSCNNLLGKIYLTLGPGPHGTGSARKLEVVSKAHELGRFSTRNSESYGETPNFCEKAVL